jgi:hypothetical protein
MNLGLIRRAGRFDETRGVKLISGYIRHAVNVDVVPELEYRDRLTCAFRLILAVPHLLLVGSPAALAISFAWPSGRRPHLQWGTATGVLGAVAAVCALIAWFAILFSGRYPDGLWALAVYYLRWRVRAGAYLALLRDEYPPFGDAPYPAALRIDPQPAERDRLSVAFRVFLLIPQLIVIWLLGVGWILTSIVAWFIILCTATYPAPLYRYGVGILRWSTRVEAYLLLLHDEYPPFSLE